MEFKSSFMVNATLIPNEFIDSYMANASGEYIKEYLYLLRHEGEAVTLSTIADALNHTEADVARAISYWKKAGILKEWATGEDKISSAGPASDGRAASSGRDGGAEITTFMDPVDHMVSADNMESALHMASGTRMESGTDLWTTAADSVSVVTETASSYGNEALSGEAAAASAAPGHLQNIQGQTVSETPAKTPRAVYSMDQISGLAGDEDFSQLLYIAQKYLNKVFTQRECEVFAYLYDGLHMTAEMLEYVVEYCVQGGHTSIRYIETVAVNWHEKGLKTVEEAKSYASSFSKDSFAVMKAFGLNDRNPAATEREMIDRWFRNYGFTRELVLEACNRTIEATHSPSFKYAEKILSEWKKASVRTLEDVKRLDEKRVGRGFAKNQNSQERKAPGGGRGSQNQFQNFPQRDIDYDALVLQQLKEQ